MQIFEITARKKLDEVNFGAFAKGVGSQLVKNVKSDLGIIKRTNPSDVFFSWSDRLCELTDSGGLKNHPLKLDRWRKFFEQKEVLTQPASDINHTNRIFTASNTFKKRACNLLQAISYETMR